jgi:hypothetical protein
MFSSFSFAGSDDDKLLAKLQNEYGYDLTHAPFFLRFAFYKEFNKDWKRSDYLERKYFLTDYEINLEAQQAKEKTYAKIQADKEKELLYERKETLRKDKDRLKARKAKEKAEKLDDKEHQKEFYRTVKDQEKILEQMKREATKGSVKGLTGPDQVPASGSLQESAQSSGQGAY